MEEEKRMSVLLSLTESLSNLSQSIKFNNTHLRSTKLYIKMNKLRLSYDECNFLVELLPKERWSTAYMHVLYSIIRWEDRNLLREAYGVQGYYHPSTRLTDKGMLEQGMIFSSEKYTNDYNK